MAPPDPILGTAIAYRASTHPKKVNLGIGAYRTNEEKPYVFKVIKQVERELLDDLLADKINKEYLPIDGHQEYNNESKKLIFGKDSQHLNNTVTVQTLSGTGALRVGFEFIREHIPSDVYVPNPTWGTHHQIIKRSGLKSIEYPYYNAANKNFDFKQMMTYLNTLNAGSIVLLHAAAHNPTGVDPTHEQWKEIAEVMKQKGLFPFFDTAYQGFATGDLEKDAFPIRYFADQGFQMCISQSYAKNMGLYSERVGALHFVTKDEETAKKLMSQIKLVIRPMYSNPPIHGALIAHRVLSNAKYLQEWKDELASVSKRILEMRNLLRGELERLNTPGNWEHITNQIGMFSYTGMTSIIYYLFFS